MKTSNTHIKLVTKLMLALVLTIGLHSCSPENGEIGPQGPQGEQGPQGPAGQDRTHSQVGEDGNVYLLPVLNFRGAQFTTGFGSDSSASADIIITARSTSSSPLSEFAISPDRGNRFRYVIIPPTVNAKSKEGKNKLNYSNYEAVKHYFDITD